MPFLQKKAWELPTVGLTINGIETTATIDTGGDILIIPEALAGEAGINALIQSSGIYAGGQKAEYGLGIAETVRLESITLTSVPVEIGKSEDVIIGTSLLRHFLSTIDYQDQQLVLRPRTADGYTEFQQETEGQTIHRIPFYLMANHILLAHGSLNNQSGLLFMIDSGLEDQNGAALTLPKQTIQYLGYTLPDTETIVGESGGGPVELDIGYISLDMVTLDNITMAEPIVIYGPFPPQLYKESLGFIVDGILSHHFLKNYSWTIDFENMEMIFIER